MQNISLSELKDDGEYGIFDTPIISSNHIEGNNKWATPDLVEITLMLSMPETLLFTPLL